MFSYSKNIYGRILFRRPPGHSRAGFLSKFRKLDLRFDVFWFKAGSRIHEGMNHFFRCVLSEAEGIVVGLGCVVVPFSDRLGLQC